MEFSRRISPITLFMLSINAVIGSGWLFAPYYAAKIAGPGALLSWGIGGIAATLIALTFAELTTMFPVAGGTAHIPQLSHGAFASFILGWIAWISSVLMPPIEVQAVLQYAALFFPSLIHKVGHTPTLSLLGYFWAAILMIGLCIINIVSYKGLMRFNFFLVIFKFSIILLTIFVIFHVQFHPQNFTGLVAMTHTISGWQNIFSAVATGGIVLAFNGFKSAVEMAGETKNLAVAIPLSIVGSVVACVLIYLGLQVCFMGALQPELLKHGWQHLSYAGDVGPFVGLAAALGLVILLKLLYWNAMLSPLGAGLIYVTSSARILYAMSKIGYVPAFLSKLNSQKFPIWAIVLNFIVGMLSFLPLPGWQTMVNFLVSAMVITYAMGPIALICLRLTLPNENRPFKLPFAYSICFLAFYCCNLFSYWTGWDTISKLAIALGVGILLFIIACIRGNARIQNKAFFSAFWILPYFLGLILISYLGAFGGRGVIPFGWDFVFIALFSMAILYLAVQCRVVQSEKIGTFLLPEAAAIEVAK